MESTYYLTTLIQATRVSVFCVRNSALWDRKWAPTVECQSYRIVFAHHLVYFYVNINLLLTEREGQYSPVRPEQARLVSSLLYGTLFLIVKGTSGGLHLKNVPLLHPSLKFRKSSIFLASAGSFNVKKDNFHPFFRCLGCKCWICRLCSKTKIHGLDRFHGNGPYCKILTEKEPIRAQGFA